MNAIFDPDYAEGFSDVLRQRLERMNPPFGRITDLGQKTLKLDN